MAMNNALWISDHTGKMEGIPSISTPCCCNERCLKNAAIDGSICHECYAAAMLEYRDSLLQHLIDNYNVLNDHILSAEEMPFLNTAIARIEAFGDVSSVTQAANYIEMVRNNPQVYAITAWTKNPDIWDKAFADHPKPANLIMIVSSLFLNKVSEAYKKYSWIDGIFTVFTADYAIANHIEINCGSRACLKCRRCYSRHDGLQFINEILKSDQNKYYKLLKKQQQQ